MEDFAGYVIIILLTGLFLFVAICVGTFIGHYQLPPAYWHCTESVVTSEPGVKPAVEMCTQYSMKEKSK
jgi:ABC-type transporter Mla maintaining outer membrane lipid asymmetry permease subunit MlaE